MPERLRDGRIGREPAARLRLCNGKVTGSSPTSILQAGGCMFHTVTSHRVNFKTLKTFHQRLVRRRGGSWVGGQRVRTFYQCGHVTVHWPDDQLLTPSLLLSAPSSFVHLIFSLSPPAFDQNKTLNNETFLWGPRCKLTSLNVHFLHYYLNVPMN